MTTKTAEKKCHFGVEGCDCKGQTERAKAEMEKRLTKKTATVTVTNVGPEKRMIGNWVENVESLEGKYILYCPTSPEPPKAVFNSLAEAIKCSYIMARKFPGQKFYPCKVEGETGMCDVKFNRFGE